MALDAATIYGFSETLLKKNFDEPKPTPKFHIELWDMCCSTNTQVAIAAPRGHAKAQALTSRILTPSGWVTIGDLGVGDTVVGGDGKPTTVTHLHPIQEMDLYRVTTRDGKSSLCNLGHLWNVEIQSNKKGIQTKTLEDILTNWKIQRVDKRTNREFIEHRYKIPAIKPVEYSHKDFSIDPYTLGAWLGDGHSAGGRFTTDDPEILTYFPYEFNKQSGKYLYGIKGLTKLLRSYGLINNKHIPEQFLLGSIKQRLALLQGLMDTDGTIHQDGKIAYFCNTNKSIIDGVISLIRSLGGVATINHNTTKCNGKLFNSWRVSCKLPIDLNPFKLKRKADKWFGSVTTSSYIVDIQKETTELGRCISVDRETYITDDYLLTHNSTSVTHAYVLASALYRERSHILIVSATEEVSKHFLGDIKLELLNNEDIRSLFGIKRFLKDAETEVVVEFDDGHAFRIVAKGSEQKLRGIKWRGKRPDLIVGDDLEEDEQVQSKERREKFRNWFMSALVPTLSPKGVIRIVGTVMHLDSLLENLLRSKHWFTRRYRAHGDEYSDILWPELWSKERLQAKRQEYVDIGNPEGYAKEYLNYPIDESTAFFKRDDFLPFSPDEHENLTYYAGVDFAISDKDRADYTVIAVVGVNSQGFLKVVDIRRGRWDSIQIIEELFSIQTRYSPDLVFAEQGMIQKSIGPFLMAEMGRNGNPYINIHTMVPLKDKIGRARSLQARMRAGRVFFNREAEWYIDLEEELLRFPRAAHDDQVDALAWIGLALQDIVEAPTQQEIEDEEWEESYASSFTLSNPITGY